MSIFTFPHQARFYRRPQLIEKQRHARATQPAQEYVVVRALAGVDAGPRLDDNDYSDDYDLEGLKKRYQRYREFFGA